MPSMAEEFAKYTAVDAPCSGVCTMKNSSQLTETENIPKNKNAHPQILNEMLSSHLSSI